LNFKSSFCRPAHRNFVVAWLIENLKRQSRGKADGKGKEQVQMFYAYDYVVMNDELDAA